MKFESGEESVKEYINNFFIERCKNQWLWGRETCGEEKVKEEAVLMSQKIRKQEMYLLFLDSFIWKKYTSKKIIKSILNLFILNVNKYKYNFVVTPKQYTGINQYRNISLLWLNRNNLQYSINSLDWRAFRLGSCDQPTPPFMDLIHISRGSFYSVWEIYLYKYCIYHQNVIKQDQNTISL